MQTCAERPTKEKKEEDRESERLHTVHNITGTVLANCFQKDNCQKKDKKKNTHNRFCDASAVYGKLFTSAPRIKNTDTCT